MSRGYCEWPKVTLEKAIEKGEAACEQIKRGVNPIAKKREDNKPKPADDAEALERTTFAKYAATIHKARSKKFRNPKHAAQWIASLAPVLTALGNRQLESIGTQDLIDVIAPIMDATPETGSRVRQRVKAIFDQAELRGLITRNPAAQLAKADELIAERGGNQLAALDYDKVHVFVQKLREHRAMLAATEQSQCAALALEFALLTASRSGEVFGMDWSEVDSDLTTWTVPAVRMKAGAKGGDHTVAISEPARAILQTMHDATGGAGLVFPSPYNAERPLSNMALTMIVRRLETGAMHEDGTPEVFSEQTTVHGVCRASFSTWANEEDGARNDVIEACLAHKERDRVKRAYNRAKFQAARAELLARWAVYVSAPPKEKVIDINRSKRA